MQIQHVARRTLGRAAAAALAITALAVRLPAQCFVDTEPYPSCNRPSPTDTPALLVEGTTLHVFVKGTDNALWHAVRGGPDVLLSHWSPWESLGGVLLSGASVSLRPGTTTIDVFVRGGRNHLFHLMRTGGHFSTFEDLGGNIDSDPASVSWAANRIDVFARNATTTHLDHIYWPANGTWSAWESLNGVLSGGPAVTSWAPNRLDVFVAGSDSYMYHKSWNGTAWSDYDHEGCCIIGTPAAYTAGTNSLFVTARGTDGRLFAQTYSGAWSGWQYELSTWAATSSPAVAYHDGVTEIVAMGAGGYLMDLMSTGPGTWGTWVPLMSGTYITGLAIASSVDNGIAMARCPVGYVPLAQDLNEGARGAYIYLCVRRSSSSARAIYDVGVLVMDNHTEPAAYCLGPDHGTRLPENLNEGTGGDFMQLCFSTQPHGDPLHEIVFETRNSDVTGARHFDCTYGARMNFNFTSDFNQGNNGKFIIMCLTRAAR
ncbi:MAG: insect kinin peptide [Gemmatimonadetes bacterium]|nr:insect kinin peptide [Gemmatimonadota bacterium]